MKGKKITQGQMKKIHALAKEIGMDDDLLHEYVFLLAEKDSLKELSLADAARVIDGMTGKKGYARGDRISYRQEMYIFSLMKKMGWTDKEGNPDIKRLNGFIKKQYGIEDYRWTTRGIASRVIEAFKELAARKGQA
ncbi:MAG: regulatory protein GemA [Acetatifactor muris]|nr:regulatory protein GemA [Acetatifactor muris]